LRASNDRALGILEQASFVGELKRLHAMNLAEIATALSRSKAWVCLRMGLLTELTPVVRQKLFAGLFPVYAYMYSVRPFMRINGVAKADIEQFVVALSGMHLSLREIDCLARGYFRGGEQLREQIRQGNVALSLEQFTNSAPATAEEETRLRAMAPGVDAYLTFALPPLGLSRHRFIRELFALAGQTSAALFVQAVERALRYRVADIATLRRIAQLYLTQDESRIPNPPVDEGFRERDAYRQGHLTDAPDFSPYDKMMEHHDG